MLKYPLTLHTVPVKARLGAKPDQNSFSRDWRGYKPHQLAGAIVGQNTPQTQPAPIPTLQTGMTHPWGQTATPDSRTPSLRLPVDLVAQEGTSPATTDLRPSARGSSPQKMPFHILKSCLYEETLQLYHLHSLSTTQGPHLHGNSFLFKHFCSSNSQWFLHITQVVCWQLQAKSLSAAGTCTDL